ncbi:MAG TPA: hypothetical protein VHF58_02685, partial [Solirubrobacterales bacterium]|nr:hypothetical protein [Solirubrobacterales bacterium]
AVPITDMGRYDDPNQPVVVIDAKTGERHPIWAEIDSNPIKAPDDGEPDPEDVTLLIRPTVNFKEGHRYIVALRNLRDARGNRLPAQRVFQLYRNRIATDEPAIEARRVHFEDIFKRLRRAGVKRRSLYLAWDFTVASARSTAERMLSIRDHAFAQLGDTNLADMRVEGAPPSYIVTGVTDYATCGDDGCESGLPLPELPVIGGLGDLPLVGGVLGPLQDNASIALGQRPEDDMIARKVEGYVVVPCYTNLPGCVTGSGFTFSSPTDNTPEPVPGNRALANFTCVIPRSATVEGARPSRPSLYGHGLLGAANEVRAGNVRAMASEHNFTFCATDWAGFATQDLPTIALALEDKTVFSRIADRIQQGMLNFLFLGRLMIHPNGFAANPAFQPDGKPVIDTRRLYYDGNSQGGILGGSLTAVAPDFNRAVLGVPGMNYSTLLRRSSDFAPYAEGKFVEGIDTPLGLYDSYPDELERPLLLSMIQMLWDRGEANGYAHHMTSDPLPNTPRHDVLLHVAFGDHQVSPWTAEVEARTIGARRHAPTTVPGRHPDRRPFVAVKPIRRYPYRGSALVVWDGGPPRTVDGELTGTDPPPTTNTPPGEAQGADPHSYPRSDPGARVQKSRFLRRRGKVMNVCGKRPCFTKDWNGR